PPAHGKVATTYAVTATGGGSGNTVTFSIDASSSTVCSISGSTVTFTTQGTCTIDANQAGNGNYNAAPQAQQLVTVDTKGDQTITFTNPGTQSIDQSPITLTATASSGLAVSFTSATASVCTSGGTNGATITFVTIGTCTINANQAGNTSWNAAPQNQQSFTISKGNQTISFTSTVPTDATVGGATYTAAAAATSGLTVTFTSATTSVCTS